MKSKPIDTPFEGVDVLEKEIWKKEVGKRIKKLRREKGLSQNELARRLEYFESDNMKATISQWETGKKQVPLERAIMMTEIFHVSLDYLFCLTDYHHVENAIIEDATGLSDKSIEVLRKNKREGDNRYLFMLDLLLSDEKDTFNSLMDKLCDLVFPPTLLITREFLGNREYREINNKDLERLASTTPDSIFPKIRNILEEFARNNRDKKVIAPNEHHPLEYTDEHVYTKEGVFELSNKKGGC